MGTPVSSGRISMSFMGDAEPVAAQNGAQEDGATSSGAPVQDVEMA